MNIFFGIIIGILCLISLVTAHEFGHFLMARKSGVRVLEFGICFPPRAIAWVKRPKTDKDGNIIKNKKGKPITKWVRLPKSDWDKPQDSLIFSLNWLPIGGFCQMDGETDSDTKKGTFGSASFWAKTKILFGGVLANWLISAFILTILAWVGMPTFLENQFSIKSDERKSPAIVTVVRIIENSPADRAGFKVGDIIKTINGQPISSARDPLLNQFAGEEVSYDITRTEEIFLNCLDPHTGNSCSEKIQKDLTLTATLNQKDNEWGYLLGVSMSQTQSFTHYTWSAPIIGIGTTAQITGETFKGLGEMLWSLVSGLFRQVSFDDATREAGRVAIGSAGDGVAGPVGIVGVIFPSYASSGFQNTAFLFAIISVSIACMNILPIPALDGGRWLMIFISRLRHKRLPQQTEQKAITISMLLILILAIIVTILDIIRFF